MLTIVYRRIGYPAGSLTTFSWRLRSLPTAPAFIAMMLGQTAWSLGSGLELWSSATLPMKLSVLDLMEHWCRLYTSEPSLICPPLHVSQPLAFTPKYCNSLAPSLISVLIAWIIPMPYYLEVRVEPFHGYWTGIEPLWPLFG